MTGFELTSKFYYVNLNYLENHTDDDLHYVSLVLFLFGLIETACFVSNPWDIHFEVSEFMNVNRRTN